MAIVNLSQVSLSVDPYEIPKIELSSNDNTENNYDSFLSIIKNSSYVFNKEYEIPNITYNDDNLYSFQSFKQIYFSELITAYTSNFIKYLTEDNNELKETLDTEIEPWPYKDIIEELKGKINRNPNLTEQEKQDKLTQLSKKDTIQEYVNIPNRVRTTKNTWPYRFGLAKYLGIQSDDVFATGLGIDGEQPREIWDNFVEGLKETFGSAKWWTKTGLLAASSIIADLFAVDGGQRNRSNKTALDSSNVMLLNSFISNRYGKMQINFEDNNTNSIDYPSSFIDFDFLSNRQRSEESITFKNIDDRISYSRRLLVNHPITMLHNSGPDFLQHKFDAYFVWNLEQINLEELLPWANDYQKGILSKQGFAVRFGSINIPKINNSEYNLQVGETQINNIGSSKEMSTQSSFTFRLDQNLVWLDAINALSGQYNTIDELIAKQFSDDTTENKIVNDEEKKEQITAQVNNHWFVNRTSTIQIDNWRKILKFVSQSWAINGDLKRTKLSLIIKGTHLGAFLHPHQQQNPLPYFIFENIKILGTSDSISYDRDGGGIQEISIKFIFKKRHQLLINGPSFKVNNTYKIGNSAINGLPDIDRDLLYMYFPVLIGQNTIDGWIRK